jgi:glycosyltransferase involved in cell wall biosynthesis
MRIAQVSTLATRVREQGAGSIEGLVWTLANAFTARGHEVTTFASAGSTVLGEVIETVPGPYGVEGSPHDWQLCEWINLCRAVAESDRFDVIHSHAYLWGIPLEPLSRAPFVHTLHVLPSEDSGRLWRLSPRTCVNAISQYQWSGFPDLTPAAVIQHGVDPSKFTFREEARDYVCFLGRFTPDKGVADAIAVARELGLRLILAGHANDYFHKSLAPSVDGRMIEYVGPVSGAARDVLLGGAQALLYPIRSPEPFGLVLIEAMMCGTPVAAIRKGAVSEIVEEGITGCIAESDDDFPTQVLRTLGLDRRRVRERAEARFSADRMACQYLQLYEGLIGDG